MSNLSYSVLVALPIGKVEQIVEPKKILFILYEVIFTASNCMVFIAPSM